MRQLPTSTSVPSPTAAPALARVVGLAGVVVFGVVLLLTAFPAGARAQGAPASLQDPLLDHLVGQWVLRGTIDGAETMHDVTADWVLGHEYVRIREVSRETDAEGRPAYEAIVFVGLNPTGPGYACLWLDNTGPGGLNGQAIGHGTATGDAIPFVFDVGGGFRTTFTYHEADDSWEWRMDGVGPDGEPQPFARLRLVRKRG